MQAQPERLYWLTSNLTIATSEHGLHALRHSAATSLQQHGLRPYPSRSTCWYAPVTRTTCETSSSWAHSAFSRFNTLYPYARLLFGHGPCLSKVPPPFPSRILGLRFGMETRSFLIQVSCS